MKSLFKNISHTRKIFIILILVALGTSVFYVGIFLMIHGRSEEMSSLTEKFRNETARASLVTSKNSFLASTVDERTKLDTYFIPKGGEVAFIELLENLGTTTKVTLGVSDVALGEVVPKSDRFGELTLRLQTTGTFAATMQFLTLLEILPYNLKVKEVYLGLVSGSAKSAIWQGVYVLKVERLK